MSLEKVEKSQPFNFGINLLKFLAIFFQIEVHAYNWLSLDLHGPAENLESVYQAKLLLLKGGFSMLVPITAAAILRMTLPLAPGQTRLTAKFNFSPYWSVIAFLALAESIKQSVVYGPGAFFGWNALHLISLCFIIILLLAKKSTLWLWPLSLGTMALTPVILALLGSYDEYSKHRLAIPPLHNVMAETYIVFWLSVLLFFTWKFLRSPKIDRLHKKRGALISLALGALIVVLSLQIPYKFTDTMRMKDLWSGILAGDFFGAHIWGFFPWGGMVLVGFLVYDLVLRFKASTFFLISLLASGLICLATFFVFFSDAVLAHCSAQLAISGFNALCFNRTPEQILLAIGVFLMIVPICIWAERLGFENGLVRSVSRSILWIYIFETSVLVWLAKYWVQFISTDYLVISFTIFALISSFGLGLLIDHFKFSLAVTLKRNEK